MTITGFPSIYLWGYCVLLASRLCLLNFPVMVGVGLVVALFIFWNIIPYPHSENLSLVCMWNIIADAHGVCAASLSTQVPGCGARLCEAHGEDKYTCKTCFAKQVLICENLRYVNISLGQ